jgi:hypothetical protein
MGRSCVYHLLCMCHAHHEGNKFVNIAVLVTFFKLPYMLGGIPCLLRCNDHLLEEQLL